MNEELEKRIREILNKKNDSKIELFEVEGGNYKVDFDNESINFDKLQVYERTPEQLNEGQPVATFMITGGKNGSGEWQDYLNDLEKIFKELKNELGYIPVLYQLETDLPDDVWVGYVFLYDNSEHDIDDSIKLFKDSMKIHDDLFDKVLNLVKEGKIGDDELLLITGDEYDLGQARYDMEHNPSKIARILIEEEVFTPKHFDDAAPKNYLKITVYEDGKHDVQELTEKAYEKMFDKYNNSVKTINGLGAGECWFNLAHSKVILCKKESLDRMKRKFNLQDSKISDIIKETKQGYVIYSEKGKRLSKAFKTRKEAEARLKEIEMFKHMKKDALIKPELAGKKVKILVGNALSHEIDRLFGQEIISKNVLDKNRIEYILPYNSMFEYIQRKWNRRYEVVDSSDYQLVNNRGHVDIYKNGKFVGSADNESEAKADIEQMKKEEMMKQKVVRKWQLWYTNSVDEGAYTIVEAPDKETAIKIASRQVGRERKSNFRDITIIDVKKEIKDMFEEVKKWLEQFLVKKDDPNNKLGKAYIRPLKNNENLPRGVHHKAATDRSGILFFKGQDYYWYLDNNDELHIAKHMHDSLDKRFFCKSYFDKKADGVEDVFETDDIQQAKEWIWEKGQKGYAARIIDKRTGELWHFDNLEDPAELDKVQPYDFEEDEDFEEPEENNSKDEYTLYIIKWYDKKGNKHTIEFDGEEDANDFLAQWEGDEDHMEIKKVAENRSYNDSVEDSREIKSLEKVNKEEIASKLKKILGDYLVKKGYPQEDVDEWVNVHFRNGINDYGDKYLEVELANEFVGYYSLPDEIIAALDKVVEPAYFEPYSSYIWQAYLFEGDDEVEDAVDAEEVQQYVYQFPSDMTENDLKKLDEYNLKFIGKIEVKMGDETFEDFMVQGSKEDLERYCSEYLDYQMHPDYLWKFEEYPYK